MLGALLAFLEGVVDFVVSWMFPRDGLLDQLLE